VLASLGLAMTGAMLAKAEVLVDFAAIFSSLWGGFTDFLGAMSDSSILRNAVLAGVLAGVACGVVGTYVVVRRITYIAGGISHSVLGGIGAAVYFKTVFNLPWLEPMYGAVVAALASALIIGLVSLRARQREDTVISAIWAIGMAAGVLFIAKTPGYTTDITSYLFGNILFVTDYDLALVAILDVIVLGLCVLFYNQFLAVCFDEEFARVRGMRVDTYYLLLLVLTALTVVLLITVVGVVLVIALLTLPVAVAGHFARRLWTMMILAAVLTIILTFAGQAIAYSPDLPPGATIVVLAGAVYLVVAVLSRIFRPGRT
jgi:zinc transport system permease protein